MIEISLDFRKYVKLTLQSSQNHLKIDLQQTLYSDSLDDRWILLEILIKKLQHFKVYGAKYIRDQHRNEKLRSYKTRPTIYSDGIVGQFWNFVGKF